MEPKMNIPQVVQLSSDVYRYAYNDDSRLNEKLVEYYKEGVKCPSVAKLIAAKATLDGNKRQGDLLQEDIRCLRGKPLQLLKNYLGRSIMALCRITGAQGSDEVKEFYEKFESKFKELYPKTHTIREEIINEGRVVHGKITPKQSKSLKTMYKYAKLFAQIKR